MKEMKELIIIILIIVIAIETIYIINKNIWKVKQSNILYNIGTLYQGEIIDKDIFFENTTNREMRIANVWGSCGCLNINYTEFLIKPHEYIVIGIKIDTNRIKVGNVRKKIAIQIGNGINRHIYILPIVFKLEPNATVKNKIKYIGLIEVNTLSKNPIIVIMPELKNIYGIKTIKHSDNIFIRIEKRNKEICIYPGVKKDGKFTERIEIIINNGRIIIVNISGVAINKK